MKIAEFYNDITEQLTKAQIEHPALNAEVLISFYFGWNRTQFYLNQQHELTEQECVEIKRLIERRITREPLQYITGVQNFYGRDFAVRPGVLIPRPETELLVETLISEAELVWGDASLQVIDVGTGSGAIAITLALETLEKSAWQLSAVDLSSTALEQAIANNANLSANVKFVQGDLFVPFGSDVNQFDIIVSNPPYIVRQTIAELAAEVRLYEPHSALDGGVDGLDYYRRLLTEGLPFLKRPGLIALEIGYNQAETLTELIEKSGVTELKIIADFQEIPRIIIAKYL
jgi:release factor glutamine methyltransferase